MILPTMSSKGSLGIGDFMQLEYVMDLIPLFVSKIFYSLKDSNSKIAVIDGARKRLMRLKGDA